MFLKKTPYCFIFFLFTILVTQCLYSQKNIVPANLNKQNNFFIENKGQWDRQVKFLASLGGLNAWVTDDGIVFDFYKIERKSTQNKDSVLFPFHQNMPDTNSTIKGHVIKMSFPQTTNPGSTRIFEGKYKQEAYYNYFIGNDSTKWASFVGLFTEVYIQNVAEGIDMRLYFDHDRFRYDFIIKPGSNIDNLVLKTEGSDGISISDSSELVFKTSLGDVINNKVFAYQEIEYNKAEIGCGYRLTGNNSFGFDAANYDHGKSLIIDPYIFSTYLGSSGDDYGYGIAVDFLGCSYITGYTTSTNFPTTTGVYKKNYPTGSSYTAFITKFNRDLSIIYYSTFIGGTVNWSGGSDIVVDSSRNIIITGLTSSSNFPVTSGVFQNTMHGTEDFFITKLNSSASSLMFSTFLGGYGGEYGLDKLKIDRSGNIWVAGTTMSFDFPVTPSAFQHTNGGGSYSYDGFISKFNSSASTLLFSSYLGGNGRDYISGLAVDKNNNAYVGGYITTSAGTFPTTTGAFITSTSSLYSGFLAKISSSGSLIYSTFISNDSAIVNDISVDQSGNVYAVGSAFDPTFPVTTGSYQTTFNGGRGDGFVLKLNSTGSSLIFSTFLGGNNNDYLISLSTDTFGNVFLIGATRSLNFPVTLNAYQNTLIGTQNMTFTLLNNTGTSLIYSTFWGNGGASSSFLDNQFTIYFTGETTSSSFPVSTNAYQKTYGGGTYDAYVVKLNPVANVIYTGKITGSPYCPGDTINIPFTTLYPLWSGNVFFAQLSDSDGSFYNPVNIGSLASVNSGVVIATIPKSAKFSRYYRIRVIATAPYIIGGNASGYFTINPSPLPGFSTNPPGQCFDNFNTKLKFNNLSVISNGRIISYNWNFGDSTAGSSVKNPTHTYISNGLFPVTLIAVSDSGCSDTLIKNVPIFHKPIASFKIVDSVQCFNENKFHFTDSSSVSYNGSLIYNWKFGDGDSSSLNNPVHIYGSFNNNYFPKLIITDSLGCKDTTTGYLKILPSPSAIFKASNTIQCFNNNTFLLKDKSTISNGNISTRYWDFGDGKTDTGSSTAHHYLAIDTFLVSLVVKSDKGCKDTAYGYLYTLKSPSADFLVNDTSQCFTGNSFLFIPVISSLGDRFRWFFGDGQSDMRKSPSHIYASKGIFNVKLIVVNNSSCFDTAFKTVYVNPEPQADFTINDSIQCLPGNSYIFNNLSNLNSANGNWWWNFGDGTYDTSKSVVHSWNSADTAVVRLTATNQFGCRDSIEKTVIVLPSPAASFIINDSDQCFNQNQFVFNTIKKQTNSNFSWSLGDGTTNLINDTVNHSYLTTGNFNVRLVLTNLFQCRDSFQKTVTVYPSPDASFTINNSSQCMKGNLFAFTSKNQPVTSSFGWNFGDIDTLTAVNPSHAYVSSGIYNVQLIVTTKDNCRDTTSQTITVKPNPVTPVASNNSPICEGKVLSFYVFSTPNSIFHWTADNGFTSNLQNPHINGASLSDSGIYYVKASLNGCESDSSITRVVIYPVPVVSLGEDRTICEGDASVTLDPGYFNSYFWQDSSTNRIFNVNKPGIYSILVTNSFGCKDSDEVIFKEKCPARIFIPDAFSPNSDGLNDQFIIVTSDLMHFEIRIFDRWGENIFHSTNPNFSWDGTYKGKPCPPGTFTYMIYTTDNDAIIRNFQGIVTLVR